MKKIMLVLVTLTTFSPAIVKAASADSADNRSINRARQIFLYALEKHAAAASYKEFKSTIIEFEKAGHTLTPEEKNSLIARTTVTVTSHGVEFLEGLDEVKDLYAMWSKILYYLENGVFLL